MSDYRTVRRNELKTPVKVLGIGTYMVSDTSVILNVNLSDSPLGKAHAEVQSN